MYPNYRLEDILVSLELAKKLKRNNIEYPTLFYWRIWNDGSIDCAMSNEDDYDYRGTGNKVKEKIPAYTVMELIHSLPASLKIKIEGKELDYMLMICKGNSDWYTVSYEAGTRDDVNILQEFGNRKLADALAEMLIWSKTQ